MKKTFIKTFIRFLWILVAALFLGVSVYNINAKMVMGNALPMPLGYGASVVLSGSMEPELSVDDLIIIRKTAELKEEQVVVYQSKDGLVVHRIIKIDGDEIITQGDANNTADDPITRDMIKGEVVFSIPNVGRVVEFLKNPFVTVLLFGAAFWLMQRSFKKEKDEGKEEIEKLKREIDELKKDN